MTKPKEDKGYKFSGGDDLTGLLKIYHETMMGNELRGGYGAYKITYAGGESGFSFGGNQMDMSRDRKKIVIFKDILESAKNEEGNAFLTPKEVKALAGKDDANFKKKKASPESIFGAAVPRINAALSSEYGRQVINDIYPIEMKKKAQYIEERVQNIKNPAAKEFYESTLGKVLLFDYHNQFYLNKDGSFLQDYIDGKFNGTEREHYATHEKFTAPIDNYTIEDHKRFILSTKQYTQTPQNCENRMAHAQEMVSKFPLELESDALAISEEEEILLENNEEILDREENVDQYVAEVQCETRVETRRVKVETLEDMMYNNHLFFTGNPFGNSTPKFKEEKYEVTECKLVFVEKHDASVGDAEKKGPPLKYEDIFSDPPPIFNQPTKIPVIPFKPSEENSAQEEKVAQYREELQCETHVETRMVKVETLEDIMYKDHFFFSGNPFGSSTPKFKEEKYEVTECKLVRVENRDVSPLQLGDAEKKGPPLKYEDIFSDELSLFGEPMQTPAAPLNSVETTEHAVAFPVPDLTSSASIENLLHPLHPEI